jgi:glycosyltransferase involved in cell wall biosynthesis
VANGEFIAFLDADDRWHPEKLVRQMVRFGARSELGLCITYVKNFWISELKEEAEKFQNHRIARPLPGYVAQSLLARRELFRSVGLFNPILKHGDVQDWFIRAAEQGVVMELLPDVLVFRRLHHSNYSREVKLSHEEHLRVLKASLDRRRSTTGKVQDYVFCDVLPDRSGPMS